MTGRRGHFDDGREINLTEPKTIHLPPTPEGMQRLTRMVEQHKEDTRNDKAQAARESDQQGKAKAMEMERPAHYHRHWHTMGEYNPDGHAH